MNAGNDLEMMSQELDNTPGNDLGTDEVEMRSQGVSEPLNIFRSEQLPETGEDLNVTRMEVTDIEIVQSPITGENIGGGRGQISEDLQTPVTGAKLRDLRGGVSSILENLQQHATGASINDGGGCIFKLTRESADACNRGY